MFSYKENHEYVVLGSGFGGGTVALRLAEAGKPVLVLERGNRWHGKLAEQSAGDEKALSLPFPAPGDKNYLWSHNPIQSGRQRLGLYELRQFRQLQGLVASGLGGGSLIWANVVIEPGEEVFQSGWPRQISLSSLRPYYDRARKILRPEQTPELLKRVPRAQLHKLAAERLGLPWSAMDLAVRFADPYKLEPNGFGTSKQAGCNLCGLCSAGCPLSAKNSVDLSYIARAEALGAQILTRHEAMLIEALPDGSYLVHTRAYDEDGRAQMKEIRTRNLIIACGTFASCQLLLRSRAAGLLPAVSKALGGKFSINGNVLCGARRADSKSAESKTSKEKEAQPLDYANGPAVTSAINFGDILVEDFAYPKFAQGMIGGNAISRAKQYLQVYLGLGRKNSSSSANEKALEDMLVYVGVGKDQSAGRLSLNALGGLSLNWPNLENDPALVRQQQAQKLIAEALGREFVANVFSTFNRQFTYHPLGGSVMADGPEKGVANFAGEVFGHKGLYLADGSLIPRALGANPAFTICAIAESVAEGILGY